MILAEPNIAEQVARAEERATADAPPQKTTPAAARKPFPWVRLAVGAGVLVLLVVATWVGVRLYVDRQPDEIRIIDIALLPAFRNAGIGSSILRDLLGEGDRTGKPVTIHVEKMNPALRLYQRLGFQEAGDVGVYWFMRYGPAAGQTPGMQHDTRANP